MTSGGPRKGAGRKPLPKKQKRSVAVQVRLTKEQKKWLDEYAEQHQSKPAEMLFILLRTEGMPE